MSELKRVATRDSYGSTLVELGKEHEEIVVFDADLAGSTKTGMFGKAFPERHFNAGIAEANVALAEAISEINYLEGNSITLIALVKSIKETDSIKSRRELIILANKAAANCEKTYTGVSEALVDLAAELVRFENDVAGFNASIESASYAALAISGSVSNSQIIVNP